MPIYDNAEAFDKQYHKNAHLQKGFNPQVIEDLVRYILRVKSTATTIPLRILDLCCGDGGATRLLLDKLDEQGIRVASLVGYDISPEQIAVANSIDNDSRLTFAKKDIKEMVDSNCFDVVLSLFGLHWIDKIDEVAVNIQQSLTDDGLLMFFVPLEKVDFFALRKQLIQSEKWAEQFKGFTLEPFISNPSQYIQAFSPFFHCENNQGIRGEQNINFGRERFAEFLTSWMQEVRHLTDPAMKVAFVNELIDLISPSVLAYPDVKLTDTGEIQFVEQYFWLHAKKIPLSSLMTLPINNTSELMNSNVSFENKWNKT